MQLGFFYLYHERCYMRSWLRSLWRPSNGGPRARRHRSRRLLLEHLEERFAPAIFNVNSLADGLLNPPAGTVTLRSAIQQSNAPADPNGNTITLTAPGDYRITLPGAAGEVDNAAGELAIYGSRNNNTNLTIVNTSGGTVVVDGGGRSRVFDINPDFNFKTNAG